MLLVLPHQPFIVGALLPDDVVDLHVLLMLPAVLVHILAVVAGLIQLVEGHPNVPLAVRRLLLPIAQPQPEPSQCVLQPCRILLPGGVPEQQLPLPMELPIHLPDGQLGTPQFAQHPVVSEHPIGVGVVRHHPRVGRVEGQVELITPTLELVEELQALVGLAPLHGDVELEGALVLEGEAQAFH